MAAKLRHTRETEHDLPYFESRKLGFSKDFKRFFTRGLAALLPTIITLSVLVYIWNFLWEYLGQHLVFVVKWFSLNVAHRPLPEVEARWAPDSFSTRFVGVMLAVVAVYVVGLFVGNLIGRTLWKIGEVMAMKIPLIRAIYPAVKQVTDFVLHGGRGQLKATSVVAVQPHEKGIWSIGLVTGEGLKPLSEALGQDMVTVFVPSSPTAFSGYVLVVPRQNVVELPMTVEEAMRVLVSGGVIDPDDESSSIPRTLRDITLLRNAENQAGESAA